ncbi:hypothetical protein Scep_022009 [Stephania cephalantha]|uniref:Uncharacterized protein n=1 Tax=Stephania cephalantha TaxID=152367 RepID=A0AAP0I1X2_9MAGN
MMKSSGPRVLLLSLCTKSSIESSSMEKVDSPSTASSSEERKDMCPSSKGSLFCRRM